MAVCRADRRFCSSGTAGSVFSCTRDGLYEDSTQVMNCTLGQIPWPSLGQCLKMHGGMPAAAAAAFSSASVGAGQAQFGYAFTALHILSQKTPCARTWAATLRFSSY